MAEFIISPGQTGTLTDTSPPVLTLTVTGKAGPLALEALQSFETPMATDIYTFTQMNKSGKRQFPTTASYSINSEMIVDKDTYEGVAVDGTTIVAGSAANLGLFGLNVGKTKCNAVWNMGATEYTADGYVTNIGPNVSTDQTVWTTPFTFTIDGDITKV